MFGARDYVSWAHGDADVVPAVEPDDMDTRLDDEMDDDDDWDGIFVKRGGKKKGAAAAAAAARHARPASPSFAALRDAATTIVHRHGQVRPSLVTTPFMSPQ